MTFVEILLASHRSARRRQRGCRALYLALGLALSGGTLFLLSALVMPWSTCACTPRRQSAYHDVQNIAGAVEQFKLRYDRCPAGIGDLKAGRFIGRYHRDPWGRELAIGCSRDEVLVCSLGRQVLDTRDDICSDDADTPGWEPTWANRTANHADKRAAALRRLLDAANLPAAT